MGYLWQVIVTYLAIKGLIIAAMFVMIFVAAAASLTQFILIALGFSEETATFGMAAATFISIYFGFHLYSAIRLRK